MSDDQQTPLIASLLERIDKLTQHIIDIKGEMYTRSESNSDNARIYEHIATIHTQVLLSLREAVAALDRRIDDCPTADTIARNEEKIANLEKSFKESLVLLDSVNRKTVNPLLATGIGTVLGIILTNIFSQYVSQFVNVHAVFTSIHK